MIEEELQRRLEEIQSELWEIVHRLERALEEADEAEVRQRIDSVITEIIEALRALCPAAEKLRDLVARR